MMTVYTISTVLVTTEAENMEEAQELFNEGGEGLAVLALPETSYSFISEAVDENSE
jgi:hypothetical protein